MSIKEIEQAKSKTESDDAALVKRIYQEHSAFIYSVIRSNVWIHEEADDIFQRIFLSLLSNPPRHNKNIRGYLYRAIINDCIDSTRKVQRYRNTLDQFVIHQRSMKSTNNPIEAIVKEEEIENLFTLVERLPSHLKCAVKLRYKENLNNGDISKKMNVNHSSIRRYISVGLKKVRQLTKFERRG